MIGLLESLPCRQPAGSARAWAAVGLRQDRARGFTLIELVVTVVVAAVLVAIALPHLLTIVVGAKGVGAKQGIHTMLLEAYGGVKSGEIRRDQLSAAFLDGMEGGSTLAEASDGQFIYYGSLEGNDRYVVEAQPIDDQALEGKTLVGCVQLDAGTIVMQRDFNTPMDGCYQVAQAGGGSSHGRGWGRGGTPNR